MAKKDEQLEVKKEQQNESLADSKKIDLYINNPDNEPKGISIMNVFSRLKERFKLYVFVMVIGLLAGLLVPTLMYTFKEKQESAVAVLALDYANADEGKAPNGTDLDITYLKSSYIIENALNNVTLSKEVTTAQVQSNLVITGILTDESKQQLEIINKLEELKNNEYGKLVQNFVKKYRPQYIVSLNNGFGTSRTRLSSSDLSHLLAAVTTSYNDYFVETYQNVELPANQLAAIDVEFLDYLDILDKISSTLDSLKDYCLDRATLMDGYRGNNGLSFSDLAGLVNDLKDANLKDLQAQVFLNNICKDTYIALNTYQNRKEVLQQQLNVVNSDISSMEASMTACEKDIYEIKTTGGSSETIELKSNYYNQLVLEYASLQARQSELQEQIALVEDRIAILSGPEASQQTKQEVENQINTIMEDAKGLYDLVSNASKELFFSNAYQNRYMHSITTYESESLRDNLKPFMMGAALGLLAGVAIWVIDAFAYEFKQVKKANEELEQQEEAR